jgi:hypothetical protein
LRDRGSLASPSGTNASAPSSAHPLHAYDALRHHTRGLTRGSRLDSHRTGEGRVVRTNPRHLLPYESLRTFRPADRRHIDLLFGNRHICVAPFRCPILRYGVDQDRIPRTASVCSGLATLRTREMRTTDNCHPHTRKNSCTRVRSFPTRSRLDFRASPRKSASAEVLRLCTDAIEEPRVSRPRIRFGVPVQPAREFSSLS